ncbi:MAG: pectin acetylesterase-family hydrolase [Oligoflexus sp.]
MGIMASVPVTGVLLCFMGMLGAQLNASPVQQQQELENILEEGDVQADWQWQAIEGSFCRDGSQAGFFVQEKADATDLVIYLEGGGACFNDQTCNNNPSSINPNQTPNNFGILDSDDERNPVKTWNKVYVPYCTGDVMAGSNDNADVSSRYRAQKFVGYRNMGLFLQDLTDRFAAVDRVLLTGESAGGFGAAYNFDRVQIAFGGTPVYLLSDSGIPFADEYLPPCLQSIWRGLWNLNETMPEDCIDCRQPNGGGIANMLELISSKYGGRQFGFLSSTADMTIRIFYGFGNNSCRPFIPLMSEGKFRAGLFDVRDRYMTDDFVTFFVNGQDHTYLTNERFYQTQANGLRVYEWVTQFVEQQASSVGP